MASFEELFSPSAEDEYFAGLEEEVTVVDLIEAAGLTEKQRFVIEVRYGLRDGRTYTQRELADLMGISRQMVASHEAAAKRKLSKTLQRDS